MTTLTPERIAELRAWLKDFHGQWKTCDCEDCCIIRDLLALLDEAQKETKPGPVILEEGSTPSPGSPEDERALDTLQDAAREGYPYVYEFNSDKELWWTDVLKAIAHLRSRLAERDALKAEVDKLITEVSHLQHDLLYEEQAKLKAEATLIEGRPLLEAVKKAKVWPDGETRIWKEEQGAILRAALAYKEQMGKDNG